MRIFFCDIKKQLEDTVTASHVRVSNPVVGWSLAISAWDGVPRAVGPRPNPGPRRHVHESGSLAVTGPMGYHNGGVSQWSVFTRKSGNEAAGVRITPLLADPATCAVAAIGVRRRRQMTSRFSS